MRTDLAEAKRSGLASVPIHDDTSNDLIAADSVTLTWNFQTIQSIPLHPNTTSDDLFSSNIDYQDDSHRRFYELAQSITGLVLYPTFCLFGLTGNVLSIVVLRGCKAQSPTNIFLIALSFSDGIKLLNDLCYFVVSLALHTHPPSGERLLCLLYPYAHYIFNMSICVTAWITVALAAERYILVCHAARAKQMCNMTRAHVTVTMVFVTMAVLSIPSALRYRTVYTYSESTREHDISINVTDLWQDQNFATAYSWTQNMVRSLIPLAILCTLNCFIVQALRRTRQRSNRPPPRRKANQRYRITLMLVSVIVVFIVCVTPDAIMSTVFGFGYYESSNLVRGVREITDVLLTVNSATNFVLYCAFNNVFRHRFRMIVVGSCCRRGRGAGRRASTSCGNQPDFGATYYIQSSFTQKSHRCEMTSQSGWVATPEWEKRPPTTTTGTSPRTLSVPGIVIEHQSAATWTGSHSDSTAQITDNTDPGRVRPVAPAGSRLNSQEFSEDL